MQKIELMQRVIMGARNYGISTVLFRHVVGARLGVHVTDMECLALLFFKGIATPTELANHTGLSSGATTAMLDRLEKGGLIERKPNPSDRRGSIISIAPSAKAEVGPLFASVREAQQALVGEYSAQELETIARFFEESTAMWEAERAKLLQHQK